MFGILNVCEALISRVRSISGTKVVILLKETITPSFSCVFIIRVRPPSGYIDDGSSRVTSNFESTYFSKGKSTDFRNVKSTPSLKNEKASITL